MLLKQWWFNYLNYYYWPCNWIFCSLASRRFSRKFVFLVTDGQSNIGKHLTVPNACQGTERWQCWNFCGGCWKLLQWHWWDGESCLVYPPEEHVFRVQKYENFWDVVKLVVKEVSPGKYKALHGLQNRSCWIWKNRYLDNGHSSLFN